MGYALLLGPFGFLIVTAGLFSFGTKFAGPVIINFFLVLFIISSLAVAIYSLIRILNHETGWLVWTSLIVHGITLIVGLVFVALFIKGGGYHFG